MSSKFPSSLSVGWRSYLIQEIDFQHFEINEILAHFEIQQILSNSMIQDDLGSTNSKTTYGYPVGIFCGLHAFILLSVMLLMDRGSDLPVSSVLSMRSLVLEPDQLAAAFLGN